MNAGKCCSLDETTSTQDKRQVIFVYRLMEVLDKGKAAAVTSIIETRDKHSGKVIFENQMTVFIRGAGGFGGRRAGKGAVVFEIENTRTQMYFIYFIYMYRSWRCFCSQCSPTTSSGCCHGGEDEHVTGCSLQVGHFLHGCILELCPPFISGRLD